MGAMSEAAETQPPPARDTVLVREAKDAPIGGQAVLEGVMMRGVSTWAVAVRKPSAEQLAARNGDEPDPTEASLGEIEITSEPLVSWSKRHRALRLPVVRGVVDDRLAPAR